jgi:hypothetical protein
MYLSPSVALAPFELAKINLNTIKRGFVASMGRVAITREFRQQKKASPTSNEALGNFLK